MGLQLNFGVKYNEFLLQTFFIQADVMVVLKMLQKRRNILVVVRAPWIPLIANKAPLMLVAAMIVELIIVIESFPTESTQWMSPKARLRHIARFVVSMRHMLVQLLIGEKLVLVSEDLLVPRAQIAHLLVVCCPHVAVQIRPAKRGDIARQIGAVVSQKQHRIAHDVLVCVADANVLVGASDVGWTVLVEPLGGVIGEDHEGCGCSAVCTVLVLVQSSHTQSTDVASNMVAGCNGVVLDGVSAYKTDVVVLFVAVGSDVGGFWP